MNIDEIVYKTHIISTIVDSTTALPSSALVYKTHIISTIVDCASASN